MANKKLTVDEVKTALEQARGLKTLAADALGVTFNTIERYIKGSVMLQDTVTTARRKRTEMAKSKLDEAIMRGESWAVMFTLKNKTDPDGEFTGETNRHELTGKDGEALIPKEADDTKAEILRKLAGIATATGADKLLERPDTDPTRDA